MQRGREEKGMKIKFFFFSTHIKFISDLINNNNNNDKGDNFFTSFK